MKKSAVGAVALVLAGIGSYVALAPATAEQIAEQPVMPGAPLVMVNLPDTLSDEEQIGQRVFDANCATCHGPNAAGRNGSGPPLVHKIYEPSHHGDEAFQRAVALGVQSHHWRFGNMPAVSGLTRADVATIIAYVRALQRANGID